MANEPMTYDRFKFEYLANTKYDDGTLEFADMMLAFEGRYPHHFEQLKEEMGWTKRT